MSRPLPLRAILSGSRNSARNVSKSVAHNPSARLSEAQLAVAREFGFASWRKLKAHVKLARATLDAIVPPGVRRRSRAGLYVYHSTRAPGRR